MMSRQILTRVAAVLACMAVALAFVPHDTTLIGARLVALLTISHLIWRYHRLADWSVVEIGRSTMAIKGAIFVIAVAANLRSVDQFTALDIAALSEGGIMIGWLCMAAALVHRDRLVVRLQGEAHALPAPPPPHYLPSEGIKREEQP